MMNEAIDLVIHLQLHSILFHVQSRLLFAHDLVWFTRSFTSFLASVCVYVCVCVCVLYPMSIRVHDLGWTVPLGWNLIYDINRNNKNQNQDQNNNNNNENWRRHGSDIHTQTHFQLNSFSPIVLPYSKHFTFISMCDQFKI